MTDKLSERELVARGLAIEQAGEESFKVYVQHDPQMAAVYDNDGNHHWIKCSCGWNINGEVHSVDGWIDHLPHPDTNLRSLDPDATQALAAHDADEYAKGYIVGWRESWKEQESQRELHDAEIERRARLDEAEWWRYLVMMHEESYFAVEGDKRLAALAESQPAPAKEDK